MEFDEQEINNLIEQLNPGYSVPVAAKITEDRNWNLLKQEKLQRDLFKPKTVKNQTPTLLQFENHFSFMYKQHDGTSWETQLRNLETKVRSVALTETQRQLKENIQIILSRAEEEFKMTWITPTILKEKTFDPTYQLVRFNQDWCCCINNKIYSASRINTRSNRGYIEYGFSSTAKPLFTVEQTKKLVDRLIGKKKV